jgi:hypothetical protein
MAMNFFIALEADTRNLFTLCPHFLGPGLQIVQCNNANTRILYFILCSEDDVLHCLEIGIKKLSHTLSNIAISISFDRSKVTKTLALSPTIKAIIGGAVTNHFLSVGELSENWVKSK